MLPAEVATQAVIDAIERHALVLPKRLQLFGNGKPLTAELIGSPQWRPRGDTVNLASEGAVRLCRGDYDFHHRLLT